MPSMTSEVIRRRKRFEEAAMLRLTWRLSLWLILALTTAILADPILTWFRAEGSITFLYLALAYVTLGNMDVPNVILVRQLRFGTVDALALRGTVGLVGTSLGLAAGGMGGLAVVLGQAVRNLIIRIGAAATTGLHWLQRPRLNTGLLREMQGAVAERVRRDQVRQ